jgi:hypothetical protein
MPFAMSSEEIEATIQWVRWAIVAIFFILTILSWRAVSKDWLNEEQQLLDEKQAEPIVEPIQEEANIQAQESRS